MVHNATARAMFCGLLALLSIAIAACGGGGGGAAPTPPAVLGVAPEFGPRVGGTTVTLRGANLTPSTIVTIADKLVENFEYVDETTIRFDTPPVDGGTRAGVTLANEHGVVSRLDVFYFIPAPVVSGVLPGRGLPEGGGEVRIVGQGFAEFDAGENTVLFGDQPATGVVVKSDTALTCSVPPGVGLVTLTLTNNNGSFTKEFGYRYARPPTASRVLPAAGSSLGGTAIAIVGTGFLFDDPGRPAVLVQGRTPTDILVNNDTLITCTTPPGTPGDADIVVSTLNGNVVLPGAFTYHPRPTLTAVSPEEGFQEGGQELTLRGTGFVENDAGEPVVTIDGQAATGVVVVDDTTLTCIAPATGLGKLTIILSNANGAAELVEAYEATRSPTLVGHSAGSLYAIDAQTGNATLIGAIGYTVRSMAFGPDATIYAITTAGELITIDFATGAGTLVGSISGVSQIFDLTFVGSRLLGSGVGGELFEVDTATAASTQLSSLDSRFGTYRRGLGYHRVEATLYFAPRGDQEWWADVDPDSGDGELRTLNGGQHACAGLAEWNGTMYFLNVPAGSFGLIYELYTVDTTTGNTTLVGLTTVDCIAGP